MRATAANVAARAAVGGDDMLSKWQLMAEQARQKREGGLEAVSAGAPGRATAAAAAAARKPPPSSSRTSKEQQEGEKKTPLRSPATGRCRAQLSYSDPGFFFTEEAQFMTPVWAFPQGA